LRASDRQKSELIFDLAHNLKAPLSGLAALAADESASPRGVSLSTVALHMARMVDEIADFAEATNSLDDQHRAKNTPTQVIEVLDTVDTLFIPTYRTKGITVVRELSPTPPPTVLVQRHKLTLLLSYLLDVSIHYSSSRMIRIRAYAGVDNTTAVVSFSDNLRSCSQEELEELFAKSPIQGYLAPVIVRKVADAIGATITFSPLAQGGSSINVLIPEVCLTGTFPSLLFPSHNIFLIYFFFHQPLLRKEGQLEDLLFLLPPHSPHAFNSNPIPQPLLAKKTEWTPFLKFRSLHPLSHPNSPQLPLLPQPPQVLDVDRLHRLFLLPPHTRPTCFLLNPHPQTP
jgi:hypothetical protein